MVYIDIIVRRLNLDVKENLQILMPQFLEIFKTKQLKLCYDKISQVFNFAISWFVNLLRVLNFAILDKYRGNHET